jgi:hypothetical protein
MADNFEVEMWEGGLLAVQHYLVISNSAVIANVTVINFTQYFIN